MGEAGEGGGGSKQILWFNLYLWDFFCYLYFLWVVKSIGNISYHQMRNLGSNFSYTKN